MDLIDDKEPQEGETVTAVHGHFFCLHSVLISLHSAWSGKKISAGTYMSTPPPPYLCIYLFILNEYFLIIHIACIMLQ